MNMYKNLHQNQISDIVSLAEERRLKMKQYKLVYTILDYESYIYIKARDAEEALQKADEFVRPHSFMKNARLYSPDGMELN